MKRKRKGQDDKVDEVEDGGRAKVVEELVLKAIHSEGERLAKSSERCSTEGPHRIFPERSLITFALLKTLRTYVEGLEVWKNTFWEWENAIFDGCNIFFQLRTEKQGTVRVDMKKRQITFSSRVSAQLQGVTVGLGMDVVDTSRASEQAPRMLSESERTWAEARNQIAETIAAKKAILGALGLSTESSHWPQLQIWIEDRHRVCVKATDEVQNHAWLRHVLDYKTAFTVSAGQVFCTAAAIADVSDVNR
jgi:hypothetical protein